MRTGCACCRDSDDVGSDESDYYSGGGYAHLDCLIQLAIHRYGNNGAGNDGNVEDSWSTCPTCKQDYTGMMRLGLAKARWELVEDLPRHDYDRLNAADRLASSLQECAGDNDAALTLFEEVLQVSREVDGDDDINTLVSMNNLASLHQKMGNYEAALPLFEEAKDGQCRLLGNTSPDTLRTISNLAMLHMRTEDFEKAFELGNQALVGRQQTLGKDHVDTLESIHNMGLLKWHQAHGEFVRFQDADMFFEAGAGAATTTCKERDIQLSLDFFKKAVDGRSLVLGNQHHLTQSSIRAFGYAQRRLQELECDHHEAPHISKKQLLDDS